MGPCFVRSSVLRVSWYWECRRNRPSNSKRKASNPLDHLSPDSWRKLQIQCGAVITPSNSPKSSKYTLHSSPLREGDIWGDCIILKPDSPGSSLAFWVIKTVDGAKTSTWLCDFETESIDALNSCGQLLFDIPITIVFIHYHFTRITKKYNTLSQSIHDWLKTNKYYSKSDEIHLALG